MLADAEPEIAAVQDKKIQKQGECLILLGAKEQRRRQRAEESQIHQYPQVKQVG
ncbi:hypothetical protein D3C71_1821350 [compost metagenome]